MDSIRRWTDHRTAAWWLNLAALPAAWSAPVP
jgi:hypothetical protein